MKKQTNLQKIFQFPLTRIIIGILVVGGSVALVHWLFQLLLDKIPAPDEFRDEVTGIADAIAAPISYILFFRFYEKRKIDELSRHSFGKNAMLGFSTGLSLQSLIILVIYIAGGYFILKVNPISLLLPSFIYALTAGFVAEILIRGIFFRLIEEKLGTIIALIIAAMLFAILHAGSEGATFLSVLSVTMQAGILVSALFIYTRSLWVSIFFHFAWDFAEPGIYGGINPGMSSNINLFTSQFNGSPLLTGGLKGPVSSIQAVLFCAAASLLFLWLAKRKKNIIRPYWEQKIAAHQ